MRSARFLVPFFSISVAISCGARSDLRATAATGGGPGGSSGSAGGSPTSGTGGMGGSGEGGGPGSPTSTSSSAVGGGNPAGASSSSGAGGGPVIVCTAVTLDAPILVLDEPSTDLSQPSLVALQKGQTPSAAIIFAKQALPQVTGPTARVGAFAAWGTWPPAAPATVDIHAEDNVGVLPAVSILASSRSAPATSSFALLYRDFAGTKTSIATVVGVDGTSTLAGSHDGGTAVMLVPGASTSQFLGGVSVPDAGNFALATLLTVPNVEYNFFHIGCATTPIAVDAAESEDGWILTTALGTKFDWNGGPSCAAKFGAVGPATTLYFARVPSPGTGVVLTQAISAAAPITRVRMARRAKGAWAVWSLAGGAALSGARLSAFPEVETTFQILASVGALVPTSFDVEPLGDTVVIGAVDEVAGSDDQIQVAALDENGSVVWSTSFAAGGSVDGPLSLKTAPDGSAVLVAWSELAPGASSHRLRIARLSCLGQ